MGDGKIKDFGSDEKETLTKFKIQENQPDAPKPALSNKNDEGKILKKYTVNHIDGVEEEIMTYREVYRDRATTN